MPAINPSTETGCLTMIIDFHVHTFPDKIAAATVEHLSTLSRTQYFTDGSVNGLLSSMKEAGVSYSVNLPVMTHESQVEKINSSMIANREHLLEQGIITFGGMHPDYAGYRTELHRLKQNGIPGIKLHPAYQHTNLTEMKMMHIIDYASQLGLIILIHAGIDIGIYDHNYADVKQILTVVDEIHPQNFVLAHMGGWACWQAVEQDLAGAPVWLDTAFSIGPLTPRRDNGGKTPYLSSNLSDEDFVRLVRKHGADKVLFATDSPWEAQKDYISRVENTSLTLEEKELIFSGNARELLHINY